MTVKYMSSSRELEDIALTVHIINSYNMYHLYPP